MRMVVKVSLVVTEQGSALPATMQDVVVTKEGVAIRLLDVISLRREPALV